MEVFMSLEDRIQHWQEKAVVDEERGKYDPPLNLLTELWATDDDIKVEKAYRDEWRNHRDQTD
jgi:hypothetical protein